MLHLVLMILKVQVFKFKIIFNFKDFEKPFTCYYLVEQYHFYIFIVYYYIIFIAVSCCAHV